MQNVFEEVNRLFPEAQTELENVNFLFRAIENGAYPLKRRKEIDRKKLKMALSKAIGKQVSSVRILTSGELGVRQHWETAEEFWASHDVNYEKALFHYLEEQAPLYDEAIVERFLEDLCDPFSGQIEQQYTIFQESISGSGETTSGMGLSHLIEKNVTNLALEYLFAIQNNDAVRSGALLPLLQLSADCFPLFESSTKAGHWYVFAAD